MIINRNKGFATYCLLERGFAHIFLLIAVFIIGIAAVGYFAFKNGQIKKYSHVDTSPTISTTIESERPEWRIYVDNNYGFQISLPSTSTYKPTNGLDDNKVYPGDTARAQIDDDLELELLIDTNDKRDLEEIANEQSAMWGTYPEYVSYKEINGIKVATIVWERSKDRSMSFVLKNTNNYSFAFRFYTNEDINKFSDVIDQILSTFKFLNENTESETNEKELKTVTLNHSEKSDWQIYTDSTANFEIQYPQNYKLSPGLVEGKELYVWNCSTKGPQGKELCTGGFIIRVYEDYNGGSRRVWLNEKFNTFKPYYENWLLAGSNSLLTIEGNPGGSSSMYVAIPKGNKMYVYSSSFVAWDPDTGRLPDLTTHKEILSTFKFTGS